MWPTADRMASAATSPSISSTSFLAPAILSANVTLFLGGANLANFFSCGAFNFSPNPVGSASLTGYCFPPTRIFSPGCIPSFLASTTALLNALPSSAWP